MSQSHHYIPVTDDELAEMLAVIGVRDMDALLEPVPRDIREMSAMDLPRTLTEAEALRLIAEALSRNPELLTYRYIEKLAPSIRTMLVPADMPYVLPIPDSLLEGEVEAVITEAPTIPEVSIPTPTPWVIQSQQYTPTPYFPEPTTVTGGDAQEPTATPTPYTP